MSAPTQNVADFLASNEAYAAGFDKGDLPMPPKRKCLVLACMDARLHPEKVLGLEIGDCHVVRNAGGRATSDALRSIAISQRLLGTSEVVIIHHTDCGMLTFTDQVIRDKIATDLGAAASEAAAALDFLPFSDLDASVRDDIATIRGAAIVAEFTPVKGFVYDVSTGRLAEVAAATASEAPAGV